MKTFTTSSGNDDVVIGSVEIFGGAEKKIGGAIIKSGTRVDHVHNFESGTLRIGAVSDSALVDAVVQVVDAASGATVAQSRTYTSASSNPKAFELLPGRYRAIAKAIKSKAKKSLEITVVAGKAAEHAIDFTK